MTLQKEPQQKKCLSCEEILPLANFYKSGKGYYGSRCKPCSRNQQLASHRNNYYLLKFGIQKQTYDYILKQQNYQCLICSKEHQDVPDKKWGRARLAVDHCHRTNQIRGLLCHSCNAGLGLFQDSPEILQKAIEYLATNRE